MATGNVTATTVNAHIGENWNQEAILAVVEESVMVPLVRTDFQADLTKMDVLHISLYTDNIARDKVDGTAVTYDNTTETTVDITIDKYKYVAYRVDEKAVIQSVTDVIDNYTTLAGRSVARAIDVDLSTLLTSTDVTQNVGATSSTAYTDITDAVIRNGLQLLDEAGCPEADRFIIISPAQKNAMLGIDKFVDASKFGSNVPVTKGLFGEIYGMRVYVSLNLQNVAAVASPAVFAYTACGIFHRDAFGLILQKDVGAIAAWDNDHQATSVVTTALYGVKTIRPTFAVEVRVTSEA
jgi:N4-gp56 family major capsid protein